MLCIQTATTFPRSVTNGNAEYFGNNQSNLIYKCAELQENSHILGPK